MWELRRDPLTSEDKYIIATQCLQDSELHMLGWLVFEKIEDVKGDLLGTVSILPELQLAKVSTTNPKSSIEIPLELGRIAEVDPFPGLIIVSLVNLSV